ncbi:DNA/RNA nuclease SfsA [Holophaga foetida]|uniref:DNA/RNA nuclease SfsA n=1 Tax=Holophaga foetida TaxID=35839 RepID=UPI00024749BC|nr:DNA/RNA nuclease SfsA [Holophaga foetida]
MIQTPIYRRSGLVLGRILKRYKRFLVDVELEDGSLVTAHSTNTGTMATCWEPGDPVLLEPSPNPKRKLPFTWLACRRGGVWIGVETGIPNKVVAEAARRDCLPGLPGLREVRTEVPYGSERSRIDVWARDPEGRGVYIEVKNATLRLGDQICFPDAVTERGLKHLRELQAMVREGHRAALVFFIHRGDGLSFDAARRIDPAYAAELDRAAGAGVEILPLRVCMEALEGEGWGLEWSLEGLLPWVRAR